MLHELGQGRAFPGKKVLPAPSSAAAAHNKALLLPIVAPGAVLPLSVSVLSVMDEGIKARNLQAPVDTDEV